MAFICRKVENLSRWALELSITCSLDKKIWVAEKQTHKFMCFFNLKFYFFSFCKGIKHMKCVPGKQLDYRFLTLQKVSNWRVSRSHLLTHSSVITMTASYLAHPTSTLPTSCSVTASPAFLQESVRSTTSFQSPELRRSIATVLISCFKTQAHAHGPSLHDSRTLGAWH